MLAPIPLNGATWLICGGRNYTDRDAFDVIMGTLIRRSGCPSRIVHGGARGADTLAGEWAKRMALDVVSVPADWAKHGRAAGPLRNQQMLDEYRPTFVIAFPGGRGTADMVRRARQANIELAEVQASE